VAEEVHRVGLCGQREQHVAGVALAAGPGGRGPGAVAQCDAQARARRVAKRRPGGFVGLLALPGEHRAREREFVERLAEPRFDLAQRRVGVEAFELGRTQLRRLAPYELRLDFVERVELVVPSAQPGKRVAAPTNASTCGASSISSAASSYGPGAGPPRSPARCAARVASSRCASAASAVRSASTNALSTRSSPSDE